MTGPALARPRTFRLNRETDVTGTSGTGDVAWGVEWPDGTCALRWSTETPSSVTYASIKDVETIHCHHGATTIVWDADETVAGEQPFVVSPLPRILLTLNCGCSTDVSLREAGRGFRFEIGAQWDCVEHGKTRVVDARWGE